MDDEHRKKALDLASKSAEEIAASPSFLAEVQSQEAAVLNGYCPEADPEDFIERRLRDLDA